MTTFQAFIMGIVQGMTEFLPISSSGHLVIVPNLLGWDLPPNQVFIFDVLVQMGTLVAVIVYFWADLWAIISVTLKSIGKPNFRTKPEVRLGINILIATIPAVVIGFLFKDTVEAVFNNHTATAYFLLLTALLLVFAEHVGNRTHGVEDIRGLNALWVGVFQALALFPGVSRSGTTITGGMVNNLKRPAAARFSFLISVPVMIGAGALAAFDMAQLPEFAFAVYLVVFSLLALVLV
jgi:undecaprenyl-diphosphatase